MISRVLVIGGYGNFGSVISRTLAKESNIQVIVAGRSITKAANFISSIKAYNTPEVCELDIASNLDSKLQQLNPDIVIHTSGPFQSQDYSVAKSCINLGIHYIDLSDGRSFVEGISTLNELALKNNVLVISGASSVPCLTSALIDSYSNEFKSIESVDYGIATAQRTARGLATTAAILGYTGKPFKTLINGDPATIYGWQGLKLRKYEGLGCRLQGNCDVPDLAIFPKRYPSLKTIRFYAGLELPFIHLTLWGLSWAVRIGLINNLQKYAPILLKLSYIWDWLGSSTSAFHMKLDGIGLNGNRNSITFELIAKSGDGPNIPCAPAIILAKKLVNKVIQERGAIPCVGLVTRSEYLKELDNYDIHWKESQG